MVGVEVEEAVALSADKVVRGQRSPARDADGLGESVEQLEMGVSSDKWHAEAIME